MLPIPSSVLSTRSTTQLSNEAEELTDAELIKQVDNLKYEIKILKLENEIIEKTLIRLDPALMNGVRQAVEYATKLHYNLSMGVGMSTCTLKSTSKYGFSFGETSASPSKLLASQSKVSMRRFESKLGVISGLGPRINVLERSELVSIEMQIVSDKLERVRTKALKQHALLKAEMEEIDVRVDDIDKAFIAFNKEVIVEGWDKIAQRVSAEIWIRFMTEWNKIADRQIDKLRLRTSTFHTQYRKLEGEFKVKTELSESLRPVDFEKLKIENAQCFKIIDQKLNQIAELKTMTGDANLNLTIHNNALKEQINYFNKIQNMIKTKEKLVVKMDKERDLLKAQAVSLSHKFEKVKKKRMAYEVPNIIDYVRVKSELTDLKHVIKTLENRLHIQQIALTSLNKKLKSMYTLD